MKWAYRIGWALFVAAMVVVGLVDLILAWAL